MFYKRFLPGVAIVSKGLFIWEEVFPISEKTFLHMNRTTLFDLSKCFLGNPDNFCPYEQALIAKSWTDSSAYLAMYFMLN